MTLKVNYSRKIFSISFLGIGLLLVIYTIFQYNIHLEQRKKDLDESMVLYMGSQMERLSSVDRMYYSIEKSLDPMMEEILEAMKASYEKEGNIDFDLDQYVGFDPALDAFIINQDNVVVRTTDPIDLGLQFSDSKELAQIRETERYTPIRVTYQTLTNDVKKYAYLGSKDEKYIFELGYSLDKFDYLTEEDSLKSFVSLAKEQKEEIRAVHLYSFGLGKSFNTGSNIDEAIPKSRQEAYEVAVETGEMEKISYQKGNVERTHLFQVFSRGDQFGETPFLVVEIEYDDKQIVTEMQESLTSTWLAVGLLILLAVITQVFVNRNFLDPLQKILIGMTGLKNKDFSTRIQVQSVYKEFIEAGTSFNETAQRIQELIEQKNQNYIQTISALVTAIDAKDNYTAGHCERVTKLTMMMLAEEDIEEAVLESIRIGSILHDIGKIGVSDQVLNKAGRLTKEEYNLIKDHPSIGYQIIKDIDFFNEARDVIHYHHERMDGKGYPDGLKGEEIPYVARVVAITDAFDAMTSKRVYRKHRMRVIEAFQELEDNAGTQFDPDLVQQFMAAYMKKYGNDLEQRAEDIEAI